MLLMATDIQPEGRGAKGIGGDCGLANRSTLAKGTATLWLL